MEVTGRKYNKDACLERFTNPLMFPEIFEKFILIDYLQSDQVGFEISINILGIFE